VLPTDEDRDVGAEAEAGMRVAVGVSRFLAVVALLLAAVPVRGSASGADGFAGTWVRAERERDDAARDAMIVRATEPMSFAFRGFARGVMRRRMVPTERYVVEPGAGAPQIRTDNGVVLPLDGQPHVTGENREVTSRVSERGEIEQSWKDGSGSHGTTTWRLASRDELVISQRVIDPHFETPLEYSTTYRRMD
jgi:hypothetical protein